MKRVLFALGAGSAAACMAGKPQIRDILSFDETLATVRNEQARDGGVAHTEVCTVGPTEDALASKNRALAGLDLETVHRNGPDMRDYVGRLLRQHWPTRSAAGRLVLNVLASVSPLQ